MPHMFFAGLHLFRISAVFNRVLGRAVRVTVIAGPEKAITVLHLKLGPAVVATCSFAGTHVDPPISGLLWISVVMARSHPPTLGYAQSRSPLQAGGIQFRRCWGGGGSPNAALRPRYLFNRFHNARGRPDYILRIKARTCGPTNTRTRRRGEERQLKDGRNSAP